MKNILLIVFLSPIIAFAQIKDSTEVAQNSIKKGPLVSEQVKQEHVDVCISGDCENGNGSMQYLSGVYVGGWKDGLREGAGKYTWTNGDTYQGNWVKDQRHGQGEYLWRDGSKYKGNYSHGVRSGYGIYYYTNGSIYEGTWQNNLKHGIANFYYKESVNIGGKYFNNEYVGGTGINQESYKYKPEN